MVRGTKYFVCTRDRPKVLERCIASVAESSLLAFPGGLAEFYVFDDSTTNALCAEVRNLCNYGNFPNLKIQVMGHDEQEIIFQKLTRLEPQSLRFLNSTCKELGRGPWDLAGARNFAFLFAYSCSHDDDLLIFLDDDILFHGANYHGHFIPIDGAGAMRQLEEYTPPRALAAVGTSYYGRVDTSIVDQLRLVADELCSLLCSLTNSKMDRERLNEHLREISLFPVSLPIRLNLPDIDQEICGPGISGALLATTPSSLESLALPRCYNEDWIWLSVMGKTPAGLRSIDFKLLHAAPPQLPITADFLAYQNVGEIIYQAVSCAMKSILAERNRMAYCRENISVEHFQTAKEDVLDETNNSLKIVGDAKNLTNRLGRDLLPERETVDAAMCAFNNMEYYLQNSLHDVNSQNSYGLHKYFLEYLNSAEKWRDLLRNARDILFTAK